MMPKPLSSRRGFLASAGLASAAVLLSRVAAEAAVASGDLLHVSINQWSVGAVRGRDKQNAKIAFDDELAGLAAAGVNGLEPGLGSADQVEGLAAQLAKHKIELRSIYTGSSLTDPANVDKELERIVALAKRAREVGTKIVVTNPSPNRQGKSDEQLKTQAAALNKLGHELAGLGMKLAYHNHDVELQFAAREFHHMMVGTDPEAVSLCLDAHWVYRGAGHSQVALFDVLKLYGSRVSELHLRQSTGNVWSEAFGDGDIDYRELVRKLRAISIRPLLVLEQGPEGETPQTLEVAEVHRRSVRYVREIFADFAG
ncbi:MAG: sugar phosphate isomerase/epimerase [Pirellulaceae bacterium]|nr:sugar phosphate isomerase/epimerase [Pirellulaceae bacterium]